MQKHPLFLFIFLLLLGACHPKPTPLQESVKENIEKYPRDTTLQLLTELPSVVDESSGIIKWKDNIWTHNDSKKQPALFEVNPADGELLRTLTIADLDNKDWEEVAQDDNYIYIGDFGNNHGTRKNLRIFKVNKEEITSTGKVTKVDTIQFSYPDQTDFTGPTHGHNYDCEAMIAVGDSLYLFSKNFHDQQSRLYSLPKMPGTYSANLQGRLNTEGTITGAGIDKEQNIITLCGYFYDEGSFIPFVWLLWDYPDQSFFSGQQRRINLPILAQVEGVCYDKEGHFFISTESSILAKGQLYRMNTAQWMK